MSRTFLLGPVLIVLLSGCSAGSIKGKVNGEAVPAMGEGMWFSIDAAGVQYVDLITTTVPNVCEAFTAVAQGYADALAQLLTDFDTDKAQAAFEAVEQDNLPEEYWETSFAITVDDLESAVDDYDLGDASASFSVMHVTGYTDWHDYFTTGVAGSQSDVSTAASGSATVNSLQEDKGMSAEGEADMVDEGGSDAGSVSWKMSGDYCQEYSDLMIW